MQWASKFTTVRNNPQNLIKLLTEISNITKNPASQKPHISIFIKIEARDRSFFRSFTKIQDLKCNHQLEFETLELDFHNNYKKKNKITQLNREIRNKIKLMLCASLFITYLRYINISDLNPHLLAQILEFGCNFFYWKKDDPKINYFDLLDECKLMYQNILSILLENSLDIPFLIKAKINPR